MPTRVPRTCGATVRCTQARDLLIFLGWTTVMVLNQQEKQQVEINDLKKGQKKLENDGDKFRTEIDGLKKGQLGTQFIQMQLGVQVLDLYKRTNKIELLLNTIISVGVGVVFAVIFLLL